MSCKPPRSVQVYTLNWQIFVTCCLFVLLSWPPPSPSFYCVLLLLIWFHQRTPSGQWEWLDLLSRVMRVPKPWWTETSSQKGPHPLLILLMAPYVYDLKFTNLKSQIWHVRMHESWEKKRDLLLNLLRDELRAELMFTNIVLCTIDMANQVVILESIHPHVQVGVLLLKFRSCSEKSQLPP